MIFYAISLTTMIFSGVLLIGCIFYRYATRKKKYDPESYKKDLVQDRLGGNVINEES